MKKIVSYFKVIIGAFIIAFAINLFFQNQKLIPNGVFGFALLYNIKFEMDIALVILLSNLFLLTLGYITISSKYLKKALLPSMLIPVFVVFTRGIINYIDLSSAEFLLIAIFGGALIGIGQSFIYKEDCLVSGFDIFDLIMQKALNIHINITNYIFDIIWIVVVMAVYGIEQGLYSIISIVIIEIMYKRTTVGVSDSKVFYIITKEEQKVKKFIMNELHYDLTLFDVKGGYSKNKNRVLMSAIPTKDYYKLREGIKEIDPGAFISITDSYELLNENVTINKK